MPVLYNLGVEMSSMSDNAFLDTNIIVYAFDRSNRAKNAAALDLVDRFFTEPGWRISTQVIQEFCNVALRKMNPPLSINDIDQFITNFSPEQVVTIDTGMIRKSLEIMNLFRLSLWDSLIVSAAQFSGCSILYSEDLSDGQCIDGLRIINPFK